MKKVTIPALIITLLFIGILGYMAYNKYGETNYISLSAIPSSTNTHINQSGQLNINTATIEELTYLNGIGSVLAERIVSYRTENGPFTNVTDLLKVSGIGESKLSAIINDICVE